MINHSELLGDCVYIHAEESPDGPRIITKSPGSDLNIVVPQGEYFPPTQSLFGRLRTLVEKVRSNFNPFAKNILPF